MKITQWQLVAYYEDGSNSDITLTVPMRLGAEIERLLDTLEEEVDEDNNRE
jgi:hypothetical protein